MVPVLILDELSAGIGCSLTVTLKSLEIMDEWMGGECECLVHHVMNWSLIPHLSSIILINLKMKFLKDDGIERGKNIHIS